MYIVLHGHNPIRLSGKNWKEYPVYEKWFGVLSLYQNNGNISLTAIRLSGALCVSQYSKNFEFITNSIQKSVKLWYME